MTEATAKPATTDVKAQVARRRVIAIISHPDAGKTTLTERLLASSGAIQDFAQVKPKGDGKASATSDWMEMEQQRGISITSTVVRFEHRGAQVNLIDTPGHGDFSEDTYRALSAVDAAVMVIDAAKGVEDRTRKLFEVCRQRRVPTLVLINKVDRPMLEPLELLDDIHNSLDIAPVPSNWPMGNGTDFSGLVRADGEVSANVKTGAAPRSEVASAAHQELELARSVFGEMTKERFLNADACPVHFGSALRGDGVAALVDDIVDLVPPPSPREAADGELRPIAAPFSGFVFKIQSNQDKRHRDRIAFVRVCSGRFERGMRVRNTRTGLAITMQYVHLIQARERSTVDQAFPGDVIGVITTGDLIVGDTLYDGASVEFPPIATFAPELLRICVNRDASKRKAFNKSLEALGDEGVVQVFEDADAAASPSRVVGGAGQLQFEVLAARMESEYGLDVRLDPFPYDTTRATDAATYELASTWRGVRRLKRRDGRPFLAFDGMWRIDDMQRKHPEAKFDAIVE